MLRWLLELFREKAGPEVPPSEPELSSLVEERRRLSEILATYREFGFEAQAEGCKSRLRQVQKAIRNIQHGAPDAPPAPEGGDE